jgi:hypothetical protein
VLQSARAFLFAMGVVLMLWVLLRVAGRGLPGGNSLSFASPKERKQRKGDPTCCVPCASLRGNLRCSVQRGPAQTRLRLKQVPALIRLNLRSSAHPEGPIGNGDRIPKTNQSPIQQGLAVASPCFLCIRGSVFGCLVFVFLPHPLLDAPRSAGPDGSGLMLV